ncbi:uncharacterized protein K02A2.6-like [Camellia sinensis]|uniref:uncharacterized protein K02A2.6-like n=1 Tax=Camellia sinensis TaxID=4442 RepID=UPI0010356CD5|nr:uncharacterized protein K02A2.6-like [Camellia sinensis]
MTIEVGLLVKEEIERLLKARFIWTARYVEWLSNVVPVMKKNGKLRVCINFRNLNIATPKDEYPMPVADLLVDSIAKHKILSFMDGHVGIIKYLLAQKTPTKQLSEVYIDDVTIKSKSFDKHLDHLRQTFQRMRSYKLKMNPMKCAFRVSAGNFLGFLVRQKGVEVDTNKAKAILTAPPPANKKEMQSFLGKAVKGQALADFLAEHPRSSVDEDLFEVNYAENTPWRLMFDGSKTKEGVGAGVVFVAPSGQVHQLSYQLDEQFITSNNQGEHEALIIGLELAIKLRITSLQVFGDSQLVIKQIKGEHRCANKALEEYLAKVKWLISCSAMLVFSICFE